MKAQRKKKQARFGPARIKLKRHRVTVKYVYPYLYIYPGNSDNGGASYNYFVRNRSLTLLHSNSGLLSNSTTLVIVPEKLMTFYHNVLV